MKYISYQQGWDCWRVYLAYYRIRISERGSALPVTSDVFRGAMIDHIRVDAAM